MGLLDAMPVTQATVPDNAPTVLLLEKLHQVANKHFEDAGMKVIRIDRALGEDELIEALEDTKCVFVGLRSKTKITKRVLETAKHSLLAIGCFCIGTNQVDLDVAARQGIPVFNSPFCNSRSVAEMIIAEIVLLSRRMGDCNNLLHQGIWHKSSAGCREVRDKTLGIVGYGHIGSQLSILADGMGMHVVYYDVLKKMPYGRAEALDSLEAILTTADFVSLHVPDTPETRGHLAGAAVDVFPLGAAAGEARGMGHPSARVPKHVPHAPHWRLHGGSARGDRTRGGACAHRVPARRQHPRCC